MTAMSKIGEKILRLPENEQLRLIARVAESLRKRQEQDFDAKLVEMATDTQIQRELREIERDLRGTEFDGLAE